ncbi:MAG: hypothetical protein M3Q81_01070 [bacterium]|nr:hypothetical protein [bacterium]
MEAGSSPEASTQLLKQKYDLHKAPEVTAAAQRTEGRTGERMPQNPLDRIQNYLNRFREITDRQDPQQRERGMEAIKRLLHGKYIVKPDEIPDTYWENQRRIIRERGQEADLEYVNWNEVKRQDTEAIIANQTSSMDKWIDYLSSPDAPYPDSIKYFALRTVFELGKYDKEKKEFPKRFTGMTQPFPELNREALAFVADALVKKYTPEYFELSEKIDTSDAQVKAVEIYSQKLSLLSQIPEEEAKVHVIEWNGKKINIEGKDVSKLRASLQIPTNTNLEQLTNTSTALKQERTAILRSRNLPEEFLNLPEDESFAQLYAYAIEKVTHASKELLAVTEGQWVKYNQGLDHMSLVTSLQGHGTGWCTAGESTAQAQLQGGDFYVYYSNDRDAKPTIPRVAIRMEGGSIAEVRGIAPEQNLDPYVAPIVEQKLEEFPDGKAYQKKVSDMKRLTEIDHKSQSDTPLDAAQLAFLYEIDSPIQGFGYSRDPRIEELRNQRNLAKDIQTIYGFDLVAQRLDREHLIFMYGVTRPVPEVFTNEVKKLLEARNPEQDMPIVFACESSQIAHNASEIQPGTRAYVGFLTPEIFAILQKQNIEHVYTSFPEEVVHFPEIWIGGMTKEQLTQKLNNAEAKLSFHAKEMMKNPEFTTLPEAQKIRLVKLKLSQLGLSGYPTTDQVYKKAQELGLELCPAEVGPQYRLQYADQPMGEWFCVGMKQITDSRGSPDVFRLVRDEDGLWLDEYWAKPDDEWIPDYECVFSLRRS